MLVLKSNRSRKSICLQKLKLIFLLGSIFIFAPIGSADELNLADNDKQKHLIGSVVVNGLFLAAIPKDTNCRRFKAALATSVVGLLKEFSDEKISGGDLMANGLGVVAMTSLSIAFDF